MKTGLAMAVALVLAGVGTGCRAPNGIQRVLEDIPVSPSFCEQMGGATEWAEVPSSWWRVFDDPSLNALVETLLQDNTSLRAAWRRLEQAGYVWNATKSARFPQVSLNASAGRVRRLSSLTGDAVDADAWTAGVAASYEVDLWQRVSAASDQAALVAQAAFYDYETLAVSLAAAVCEAWFDVNAHMLAAELLRSQRASVEKTLDAVESRYRRGVGDLLDVYQQQELVAGVRAQIPAVETAVLTARNRLAVLTGMFPGEGPAFGEGRLPPAPEPVMADIDALAVENRPDVRAALARLGSAERGVALAWLERVPALRANASLSSQAETPGDLFDAYTGEALMTISLPILDGGRRRNEARRAGAQVAERLDLYAETVRQSMREIHDARLLERSQTETIALLEAQLDAARRSLERADARHAGGLADFLTVLGAQTRVLTLERSLLAARRQRLSYRVQFCRALAGSDVKSRARRTGNEY